MTQVTFDLVEFQQPIEDYIDHAQASLITQKEKRARHGIMAVGKALALVDLVMPRVAGNDLQKFAEYRRQAQALIISFWADFGLIYLKRASDPEVAVVRKIVRIGDDNGHVKDALPMQTGKPRGRAGGMAKRRSRIPHEEKMLIGELAAHPPEGVAVEKWFQTIMADHNINSISGVYAHRAYYYAHQMVDR